jgi:hypothetical protein
MRGAVIVSKMFDSLKKGLEEAISDAKGTIKLERHTVENNVPQSSKKVKSQK